MHIAVVKHKHENYALEHKTSQKYEHRRLVFDLLTCYKILWVS